MNKRILVAVVCVPLIFIVVYLMPPVALPIAISILSVIALFEALRSTGLAKDMRLLAYSIVLAALIPFWSYLGGDSTLALCGLFAYVTLLFIEAINSNFSITVEKMSGFLFFTLIIPYFMSSFVRMQDVPGVGVHLVILPLVTAFTSDACALFAGMFYGRRKLAPELSPKKTIEGAIGGLVGAMVCTVIYGLILQLACKLEVQYFYLMIFGVVGSVFSQMGDLFFSYMKRQYKIKDFGKIFPGHGGVLDRFDSVIFCAPLFELLFVLLPAFAVAA